MRGEKNPSPSLSFVSPKLSPAEWHLFLWDHWRLAFLRCHCQSQPVTGERLLVMFSFPYYKERVENNSLWLPCGDTNNPLSLSRNLHEETLSLSLSTFGPVNWRKKKKAQPKSWELCFTWWTFWGLQAWDTASQIMLRDCSEKAGGRGGRGGEPGYVGVFATKDQVAGTSKDCC